MIKEIISGREENASLFLHCMCGKEIIQVYYYKEDSILNKIIGLRYYGNIDKKDDLTYAHFQFTENSFCNFVNSLEEFIESTTPRVIYMNHFKDILELSKDKDKFYSISRFKNFEDAKKKKKCIWDITFRDPESKEFLSRLKDLKSQILQDSNERIEKAKIIRDSDNSKIIVSYPQEL